MKRKLKRGLIVLLSAVLLLSALPASLSADTTGFPDVMASEWYADAIEKVTQLPGVLNGIKDEDGVTRFYPENNVKRGEFLKMAIKSAELFVHFYNYDTDKSRDSIHWAGQYYTKALEDNILTPNILGSEDHDGSTPDKTAVATELFPCTWEALEQPITRYEMAVIISNLCSNTLREKTIVAADAWKCIPDYDSVDEIYVSAVEQAYGKGILTGFSDGSFQGELNLTRGQAAAVIERLLWDNDRKVPDWSSTPEVTTTDKGAYLLVDSHGNPDPSQSFANWLRNGHVDGWGNIDAEAKIKLFGNAYKSYFVSSYDAAAFMETVSVPIWTVDASGQKIASTVGIQVNKVVAAEVHDIFQMIFDDPEQFPIYGGWSAGGARFSDTMRHSWGCAIDVNALYNCECNTRSGALRVTCGYGWWPQGTAWTIYAGSLTAPSIYSIGKNPGDYGYSVVKAFATYGWGWGGNGWSNGQSFDYMHFSVLPSGG